MHSKALKIKYYQPHTALSHVTVHTKERFQNAIYVRLPRRPMRHWLTWTSGSGISSASLQCSVYTVQCAPLCKYTAPLQCDERLVGRNRLRGKFTVVFPVTSRISDFKMVKSAITIFLSWSYTYFILRPTSMVSMDFSAVLHFFFQPLRFLY